MSLTGLTSDVNKRHWKGAFCMSVVGCYAYHPLKGVTAVAVSDDGLPPNVGGRRATLTSDIFRRSLTHV